MRDKEGKIVGIWVAKTVRGFNKKQREEIRKARQENGK